MLDRDALLGWWRPRRVPYPWRSDAPDPYAVLVSEVMLQQTQAARVAPVFTAFLARFPTVADLAAASLADVVRAWSGLGYNRRAVALWGAARALVDRHGGRVPADPGALRALPGVGHYTAAAVASIAHGVPVAAVDTNVRRVLSRAVLGVEPHEARASAVEDAARACLDPGDPRAWNQALMDLGREVCRPTPLCGRCPVASSCRFDPAAPRPPASRQARRPFRGSSREIRGAVVRVLRRPGAATVGGLAADTGHPIERVRQAIAGLVADGLVRAGPAALAGRPAGRVRLADSADQGGARRGDARRLPQRS